MNDYESHEIGRDIVERYREKTGQSARHFEAAKSWLPGGETRRASYFPPYPTFMEKGEGCYLYDCDGNKYIDMQNNYTSLIHGHAHPRINEVARDQMEKGVVLGSAAEIQYRYGIFIDGPLAGRKTENRTGCLRGSASGLGSGGLVPSPLTEL